MGLIDAVLILGCHSQTPWLWSGFALLGLWRRWSALPSLLPWHLLLFMDNILLAASSWDELLDKLLAVQAALHTYHWPGAQH
eukprot:1324775-Amphidinium_carterae.1